MKKIVLLVFVTTLSVSCSQKPDNVAAKFVESIAKGDIEEAEKYSTEQTASLLKMAKGLIGTSMPTYPTYKFEKVKDSIVEDKAWITYKTPTESEDVIELIKENGNWKVSVSK